MSPLDRLQELLDVSGVKYERRSFDSHNHGSVEYVTWRGVGGLEFNAIRAIRDPDMLFIDNEVISPENAVDATVGTGACRLRKGETTWFAGYNGYVTEWTCDECGGLTFYDAEMKPRFCADCGRKVVE